MNLTNKIYFILKPILPTSIRYSIRRLRAHYQLLNTKEWPIMESAAQLPPGWPGWPEGKQFAFVLTHDVEGSIGMNRCEQVAAMEMRKGFRSSFNFVPEGEYRVSPLLREKLSSAGFEIGVHDFRHDGSLYRSRRHFFDAAKSINRYLKEWNAVGFRAGFMFHNLEWLKAVDIEYDASTFDTDPFEPQPDGTGTIFPFWIEREHKKDEGFVELPYTLPQDSTLYLIFREKTIDVWKRKVDWLAEKGGMVLVNVHPDYLALDEGKPSLSEYPFAFYEEFLDYVKKKYDGAYWQVLPREMAQYIRGLQLSKIRDKNPKYLYFSRKGE
jgi:hypothetical protein